MKLAGFCALFHLKAPPTAAYKAARQPLSCQNQQQAHIEPFRKRYPHPAQLCSHSARHYCRQRQRQKAHIQMYRPCNCPAGKPYAFVDFSLRQMKFPALSVVLCRHRLARHLPRAHTARGINICLHHAKQKGRHRLAVA